VKNMLMGDIDYKIEPMSFGVWRRYLYPSGLYFEEFISHQQLFGMPLLNRSPKAADPEAVKFFKALVSRYFER
jgi:hypothetical protein